MFVNILSKDYQSVVTAPKPQVITKPIANQGYKYAPGNSNSNNRSLNNNSSMNKKKPT